MSKGSIVKNKCKTNSPQGSWLMTVTLLLLTHAALFKSHTFLYVTWSLPHTPSPTRPFCFKNSMLLLGLSAHLERSLFLYTGYLPKVSLEGQIGGFKIATL